MSNSSESLWSRMMYNKAATFLTAMILLVPLVLTPIGLSNAGFASLATVCISIVLLVLIMWQAKWNVDRTKLIIFLKTGANGPILALLLVELLSVFVAKNRIYAVADLLRLGSGIIVYFAAAYYVRRSFQMTWVIDGLIAVASLSALVGFIQYGSSDAPTVARGAFSDHQLYASFMMLLMPLLGVIAVMEPIPGRKIAAQIATMFTLMALLLTHHRSSWLGAACGLGVIALVALYVASTRTHTKAGKHEFTLPIILLLASSAGFVLFAPMSSSIISRVTTLGNMTAERSWQFRQVWVRGALDMIKAQPILGFGAGNFPYSQNLYTHTGIPTMYIPGPVRPSLNNMASNYFLQTGAELGVIGLALLVVILAMFLIFAIQRSAELENGVRRTILLGAIGSVIAFTVDAIGSPSYQFANVSMFFWLILGLGTGCMRPRSRRSLEYPAQPSTIAVARTCGVLCGGLLLLCIPILASNQAFPEAENLKPLSATISPLNLRETKVGASQDYTLRVVFTSEISGKITLDMSHVIPHIAEVKNGKVIEGTIFKSTEPGGGFVGNTFRPGSAAGGIYIVVGSYRQVNGTEPQTPASAATAVCVESPTVKCGTIVTHYSTTH